MWYIVVGNTVGTEEDRVVAERKGERGEGDGGKERKRRERERREGERKGGGREREREREGGREYCDHRTPV